MNNLLVFDIEANGFLNESTAIHCISYRILNEDKPVSIFAESLNAESVYNLFSNKNYIIGHNIISYDIPMIKKFYDIDLLKLLGKDAIIDTYVWSRVSFPDRPMPKGCPKALNNPFGPNKKIGPHGLESWGWRVGERKLTIHDWSTFTPEMIDRCEGDVTINLKTYLILCNEMRLNPYDPYNIGGTDEAI